MTRGRALRLTALAAVALASIPLLSGCSARFDQLIAIAADGGGNLTVELHLDREAQDAINLPAQLQAGTLDQFLKSTGEQWSAPGAPGIVFRQAQQPDGTVVLTSVHRLRAGVGDLADLRSTLASKRPLQPILTATGRYWSAPISGAGSNTTANRTTGASQAVAVVGESESGITGFPTTATLQTLLTSEFTPATTDRSGKKQIPTFTIASRGGLGEVLDPVCDARANRYVKTRADRALVAGLNLRYQWAMPTGILETSEGAVITGGNATATWSMPYGQCDLIELSSAGADDGRFVNGLILSGATLFLLIVFAWRGLVKRRRTGTETS